MLALLFLRFNLLLHGAIERLAVSSTIAVLAVARSLACAVALALVVGAWIVVPVLVHGETPLSEATPKPEAGFNQEGQVTSWR
jgi:hypothetical protein